MGISNLTQQQGSRSAVRECNNIMWPTSLPLSLPTCTLGPCSHDVEARNKSYLKTTLLGLFFLFNGVKKFLRTQSLLWQFLEYLEHGMDVYHCSENFKLFYILSQHGWHYIGVSLQLPRILCFQEPVPNMDMVDPVICSGESQCFEEYFARSVQCIMGLTKCKQTAVKTSNMAAA